MGVHPVDALRLQPTDSPIVSERVRAYQADQERKLTDDGTLCGHRNEEEGAFTTMPFSPLLHQGLRGTLQTLPVWISMLS